jgi:hypothetical protein
VLLAVLASANAQLKQSLLAIFTKLMLQFAPTVLLVLMFVL